MGRSLNETPANVKCFSITLYELEQYRLILGANLELAGKDRQVTNYDRQVVEHGDCVAYCDARATVHAPGFASRCARLLRRDRPRLKARAAACAELCYLCAVRRGIYKFVPRNSSLVLLQIALFLIVPTRNFILSRSISPLITSIFVGLRGKPCHRGVLFRGRIPAHSHPWEQWARFV